MTGEACIIFGKPFKRNDINARKRAEDFAIKAQYTLTRDVEDWKDFFHYIGSNQLVCVCSNTRYPGEYYFDEFGGDGVHPISGI